jgi:hypothetical protein
MKKTTFAASAAILLSGVMMAQAPRFVALEHFTQASCGPCASQNPAFEANIINPNTTKARHIAYHTSWPGVDPMYNHNTAGPTARVNMYTVTGVPTVVLNGNQKRGNPSAITQADIDNQFSMGSPIKIDVTEVDNGNNRDLTVNVKTVGTVPSGTFKLYVAIVEDPIDYTTPPGSNGETHFPNVFRLMLPTDNGDAISAFATIGNSISFNYNYNENAAWNTANIKAIAFVQNTVTKEIIQMGTVADPIINYTLSSPVTEVQAGTSSNASSFTLTSMNSGSASEDFVYTLTTNIPNDWSAGFSVNSNNFTNTATITTGANATNNIGINITPGTTPFVGKATLTVTSVQNPTSPALVKTVYVISNVTDLIVNNSGGIGDGVTAGSAANWDSTYVNGLVYANENGWATTDDIVAAKAIRDNAFAGVINVYYNVGWTFPGLTNEFCTRMTAWLNAGGNMFIAGQDIGWETWDTQNSPYYTATTQQFWSNFFGATFSADGGTSNSQLTAVTTDLVFGTVPNSTILNFYGGNYFYPDEVNASGGGVAIFKYNNGNKTAGTRKTNGTYKVVYLGIGVEMVGNTTSKYEILKWSHDWFYGLVSTEEFDAAMNNISLGQNFPNPANTNTTIAVNADNDMTLEIMDIQGRVVMTQQVVAGTTQVEVNTSSLVAGMYMYRLVSGYVISEVKRMEVVR